MTADVELLPLPESVEFVFAGHDYAEGYAMAAAGKCYYTPAHMQSYALAYAAKVTAAKDAEIEALRAKTAVTMGVGTGDGSLFVHGDHESIKAAQAIVLQRDALRSEVERLKALVRSVGYETLDRAEKSEARAEQLAEALRLAEEHINALTPEWYSAGQRVLAAIRAALNSTAAQQEGAP